MTDKAEKKISIVIPTKNRAELLINLLECLGKQQFPKSDYEVIVIDNGSTDDTRRRCREAKQKWLPNLRYIYDSRPGLHVGRNRGLLESRSNIVAYIDDDEIPFPNWIEAIVRAFEDKEVKAVCGAVIPDNMSILPQEVWKRKSEINNMVYLLDICCFWEKGITEHDMRIHRMDPRYIFGGNSAYRKEVLLQCKGFHPDSMPNHLQMYRGDGECYVGQFLKENRMKCMYVAQMSVYHIIKMERLSPAYLELMQFRAGISKAYTILRNENILKLMLELHREILSIIKKKNYRAQIYFIKGEVYLSVYYCLFSNIRKWIHKENYY